MREKFGVSKADFLARFNLTEEDVASQQPQPAAKRAPARPRAVPRGLSPSLDRLQSELQGRPQRQVPPPQPNPAPAPPPAPAPQGFDAPPPAGVTGFGAPPPAGVTGGQPEQEDPFPDWIDTSRLPTSEEEPEDEYDEQIELVDWSFFVAPPPAGYAADPSAGYVQDALSEPDDEPEDVDEGPEEEARERFEEAAGEPSAAEPGEDLGLVEDAKQYMMQLENNKDPRFQAAADAIRYIDSLVEEGKVLDVGKKQLADGFGFVIGSLQKLENDRKEFGDHEDDIMTAVYTLNTHYGNLSNDMLSTSRGMPGYLSERINHQVDYITRGPRQAPLQRRTSQWHSINTIWERNRIIDIMRLDDKFEYDLEGAENKARDEWNRIVDVVDELTPNAPEEKKEELRKEFALLVLGRQDQASMSQGMDFDAAERLMKSIISNGYDGNKDFTASIPKFKEYEENGRDVTIDEQAVLSAQMSFTPQGAQEELENIPEDWQKDLMPYFIEFGHKAIKFINMGSKVIGDTPKAIVEGSPEGHNILAEAQELYAQVMNAYTHLMMVPTTVKMMAEDEGQVFKEAYKIKEVVVSYKDKFGIESSEGERQLTPQEQKEIGHVDVGERGRVKKRREHRNRKWETEQRARDKFLDLLKHSGRIWDYYKKRRDYMTALRSGEMGVDRQEEKLEEERILNNVNIWLGKSVDRWKDAAFSATTKENRIWHINKALEWYAKADRELFKRLAESWLDEEKIAKIEQQQLELRKRKYDDLLFEIENPIGENAPGATGVKYRVPKQVNYNVVEALREHVNSIDEKWERAKREAQDLAVVKFEPGDKGKYNRRDARIATQKTAWMADVFFRYATLMS